MNDISGHLCRSHFTGVPCATENCIDIHLLDYQVTQDDVLQMDDLFYLQEQNSSIEPVKVRFTPQEKSLLEVKRPVLCYRCMMPINPQNDNYFSCCDCFMCQPCCEQWIFKLCCPKCGKKYESYSSAPQEIIENVTQSNSAFLSPHTIAD